MKKALALLLVLLTASFVFAGGASESTTTAATETQAAAVPEEFHIGIVTELSARARTTFVVLRLSSQSTAQSQTVV